MQILCLESCFVVKKKGFPKMGGARFFSFGGGGVEGLGDCHRMMLLDALEGCSKNIKIVFLNTLLLDAKNRNMQKKKKAKKLHPFLRGLKNGQEVVPLFFQKGEFSESSKTLIL